MKALTKKAEARLVEKGWVKWSDLEKDLQERILKLFKKKDNGSNNKM